MADLLLGASSRAAAEDGIRAAVDRVLRLAEVRRPPAPLELIASLRDIRRIVTIEMDDAGRLVRVPEGGYLVQVNAADAPGRQRFSIAHEICHTFFDEARNAASTHDDPTTGTFEGDDEEVLCDVGAAHMLLHPRWVRELARGRRPSLDCLFDIASRCEASAEATALQVARLGLWRCSFVFWEPGYRKGEAPRRLRAGGAGGAAPTLDPPPKLRAARIYHGRDAPFFPRQKSVPEDSSIARALLERERTTGTERFEIGGAALIAECESQYAGYTDGDGHEVPRVLTLLRWRHASD